MDDALDTHTWTIVVGVVLGFFAVPATMLAYDLRRQLRRRRSTVSDPSRTHLEQGR